MTQLLEDEVASRDNPPNILGYATPAYCAILVARPEPTIRDWAKRGRVRTVTVDGNLYLHTGDVLTEDTRARRRAYLRPKRRSAYITNHVQRAMKQADADEPPPDSRP